MTYAHDYADKNIWRHYYKFYRELLPGLDRTGPLLFGWTLLIILLHCVCCLINCYCGRPIAYSLFGACWSAGRTLIFGVWKAAVSWGGGLF